MRHSVDPVLDALRAHGVADDDLLNAQDNAGRTGRELRDVLVDIGVITELQLADAVADAYGTTRAELTVDPSVAGLIPLALTRRHRIIGLRLEGDELIVATTNPGDVVALDDVRAATGRTVRAVVVPRDDLSTAIERLQRLDNDLTGVGDTRAVDDRAQVSDLTADGDEPIVRYVNALLEQAIANRASDLHIEPSESDIVVRTRIDGVLHELDTVPRAVQSALISRLKIMAGVDITERRIPQNGRITADLGARSVDLRVATLPTVWGEKIVLRVLDTEGIDLDLDKLGFSPANLARFSASFAKPHGMVLVTGPTGSGKSTTLYATLARISSPAVNIITVEDPVEYRLRRINQIQVNPKAGLTFAAVLPAILRSDPDVILVGEIRDRVTAQLAIEAALTGHLVLSTLHTNDAPSAVVRLVEMGIEPFLVGSSLDCVLAQRLARRLCEWCKETYAPSAEELDGWPTEGVNALAVPEALYRAVGCRSCAGTGYRGRIAIHEVMPVSEQIERMTSAVVASNDIAAVATEQGMVSLRTDGLIKAVGGQTTLAEVIRVTVA